MRAIVYLRVSTDEQAESGLGLEAQRAACEAKARDLGAQEVTVFADEGIGGSTPVAERPGLTAALEAIREGDLFVVAKRDRIARDYMLAGWVDLAVARARARLVSAAGEGTDSDDPMSRVMRVIVDAFAQYERDMIRARTKGALKVKRSRGEKTGGAVPFGYRIVSTEIYMRGDKVRKRHKLGPDAGEQEAIRTMRALREQGLGYRAIAAELARQGIRGRGCSALGAMTVRRLLQDDPMVAVGAAQGTTGGRGAALEDGAA
jgi:DNA invertase Pin-like site-specific DNA recombinase